MKPLRVIVAALVGGIIVFAWSSILHMATPLGHAGVQNLPNEATLAPAMKQAIAEPGFYMFPGMKEETEAEQKIWEEKYKAGPAGLIVYKPVGGEFNFPKLLVVELAADIGAALIAACLLGIIAKSGCARSCGFLIGAAMGVFGWLNLDVSYWNWYDFPCAMILASLVDQGGAWLIAGGVMGFIVGKVQPGTPAA